MVARSLASWVMADRISLSAVVALPVVEIDPPVTAV